MKLAILCQEEPIFLGPFLRRAISMQPDRIAAVFVAGRRSGGEKSVSLGDRINALRAYWNIMEPMGFLAGALLRLRARLLRSLDPRSVAGLARRLDIPVFRVGDPNGAEFQGLLREVAPDVVLNQSETILRKRVLSIPRLGFLNRHASLLPCFPGRMASFWSHAAEPPSYGITFHLVDEGVDTGAIVLQHKFEDINPAWPYPKVLKRILEAAPELLWKALDLLADPRFSGKRIQPTEPTRRFPTLAEARSYRKEIRGRRRMGCAE